MMTLDQILSGLARLEAWQARAMCASAAERAAPLFRKLGRPKSQPIFEQSLDAVWAAVARGGGGKFKRPVQRLPEAGQDDSHNPEYYAGRMLQVLFLALDQASAGDTQKGADCIEAVASLCDGIDTVLTAAPGQTFRYDPKHPFPPGEVETHELLAAAAVLESLRHTATPDAGVMASLRQHARERATIFAAVVPRLIARHKQ